MQLYKLDFPNSKSYIGITTKTAQDRLNQHCRPSQNKNTCQKAIHKYGKENVVLTVLATVDNWELLCLAEIEAIEKFNTFFPNGYNLTLGGEGGLTIGIYGEERIVRDKEVRASYYIENKVDILAKVKAYRENNKAYFKEKAKERYSGDYREYISAKSKGYYENNKVDVSERRKANRKANKSAIAKKEKAYRDANKERITERQKSYQKNNKEGLALKAKAYREANKLDISIKAKIYQDANKIAIAARKKEYNEANKSKVSAYKKAYHAANKEEISAKRKAIRTAKKNAVIIMLAYIKYVSELKE